MPAQRPAMPSPICLYRKTLLNCFPGNCRMLPFISRSKSVARTSEEFKPERSTISSNMHRLLSAEQLRLAWLRVCPRGCCARRQVGYSARRLAPQCRQTLPSAGSCWRLLLVCIARVARCKTAAIETQAAMLPQDEACRSRRRAACLWEG